MQLQRCNCDVALSRVQRSWWMRIVFPTRHLYHCRSCRHVMLIHPGQTSLPRVALGPNQRESAPKEIVK